MRRRPSLIDRPRHDAVRERAEAVPAIAVLDNWAHAEWTDGCQIDELPALQTLTVFTMNHLYEIIVLAQSRRPRPCPRWAVFSGVAGSLSGRLFSGRKLPEVARRLHRLLHGADVGGEVIVTSPVQKLTLSSLEAGSSTESNRSRPPSCRPSSRGRPCVLCNPPTFSYSPTAADE